MNKYNDLLKISGILNIILSLTLFKSVNIIFKGILLIPGIILLLLSENEDNNKYFKYITILAIIMIPFNFIVSCILYYYLDKISTPKSNINGINAPPKVEEVDPESKKIDTLLKLGVLMIFISGLLCATTSWSFITDFMKVILLGIVSCLFFGLSIFSEKKLHIKKTTYTYYILGMIFLLLVTISTLYFSLLGPYLTYIGPGKYLSFAITYLVLATLTSLTYSKLKKNYLLYIFYTSTTLVLYNLLKQFITNQALILVIISSLIFILTIISKKDTQLSKCLEILPYILIALIDTKSNHILIFIYCLINIVTLYYSSILKNKDNNIINLIFLYTYIIFANTYFTNNIFLLTFSTINTLLIKYNLIELNDKWKSINYLTYSIIILYIEDIFSRLIYLIVTIINAHNINNLKEIKISTYLEPLAIYLLILPLSTTNYIANIITITWNQSLLISSIIYCLIDFFITKNKLLNRKPYKVALFITIIISLLEEPNLLILIPAIYLFYNHYTNKEKDNNLLIFSYILMLITIYSSILIISKETIYITISSLVFILLLVGLIFTLNNDYLKKVNYISITFPLLVIIDNLTISTKLEAIFQSIIILYITFLLVKLFIKTIPNKNAIAIIGIIISLLELIKGPDLLIGLYIGIIALIVIIIGFKYKDYDLLFNTGIIITIINIFYQLYFLWENIPFWVYLFLAGITIIGFVTYKELKK